MLDLEASKKPLENCCKIVHLKIKQEKHFIHGLPPPLAEVLSPLASDLHCVLEEG